MKVEFKLKDEPDIFDNDLVSHEMDFPYRRPVSSNQKVESISNRLEVPEDEIILVR